MAWAIGDDAIPDASGGSGSDQRAAKPAVLNRLAKTKICLIARQILKICLRQIVALSKSDFCPPSTRKLFCETAFKLPHALKGNFLTFLGIFGELPHYFSYFLHTLHKMMEK